MMEERKVPKVSAGAIIRGAVLAIAILNGILLMFGQQALPIGEVDIELAVNAVYAAISAIAVIVAAAVAYWKDNDITRRARSLKKYIKR